MFGAAGSIGSVVTKNLHSAGHKVIACVRTRNRDCIDELKRQGITLEILVNVAKTDAVKDCAQTLGSPFDGIIYAVGHCPPGGFQDAVGAPLKELSVERYEAEVGMHQLGVLNVFQCFAPLVTKGGCFVFLSSAITRLKNNVPAGMHLEYHAGVVEAGDWLIRGMRKDPFVLERGIKIHRIAPAAVDTPFHEATMGPRLIPVDVVARTIIHVLKSDRVSDEEIVQ